MSTSGDISKSSTTECDDIGSDDDEKKMCTSYEQKSNISGGEGVLRISMQEVVVK